MTALHRRYEVHPRRAGDQWELHISGVGMITAVDLTQAPEVARAYIAADLGHHALHDAEIVLLDAWPPDERALSDLQLH
jgi:hypothetical protein